MDRTGFDDFADKDAFGRLRGLIPAQPDGTSYGKEEAAGRASSDVSKNADVLGNVFVKRFGDCAAGPNDTQVLVDNAKGYADRYALEARFRRCASRVGVPNARAAWFVRGAPELMASPKWCLSEAFWSLKLPMSYRVQPYRFAVRTPMSETLRGSLRNEGFAYQFAARVSAVAFLVVSVWLAPTVSYGTG